MSDTTLLILEVVEFKNMADWVWRLKNSRGRVLGEYAVKLKKEAPEYAAFRDLYAYLRANVAPDNSADDGEAPSFFECLRFGGPVIAG